MNWEKFNKIAHTAIADGKYCLLNMKQNYRSHCCWSENSASKCEKFKDFYIETMFKSKEEVILENIIEVSYSYFEKVCWHNFYEGFKYFEGIFTRIEYNRDDKSISFTIYKRFDHDLLNKIAIPKLSEKFPEYEFKVYTNKHNLNYINAIKKL